MLGLRIRRCGCHQDIYVVDNLRMTRHIIREYGLKSTEKEILHRVSGLAPGVMAQTGMETSEIVMGVVAETKPDLVIYGRCPGSPQYPKAEPDSPDHGYGDSSRFRGGKSQDRTY